MPVLAQSIIHNNRRCFIIHKFSNCTSIPVSPVNCSDPTLPGNGYIKAYHNTTEGAEIFFRCSPGFVPAGRMRAICEENGRWNPDPSGFECTCEYSHIGCIGKCFVAWSNYYYK